MEKLKTLLIANRGEIAVRLIRTAKKLGVKSIAIYTSADAASSHVSAADKAVLLQGSDSKAYIDGEQIVRIAKENKVDAVIPGYGFLSENIDFAQQVMNAGMVFAGPSPKCIEDFGIKHTARKLAQKADVPIVPGTDGLVQTEDEAIHEAKKLTFPVMLKATAGGGGMGLLTCQNEDEVRHSFKTVQSRGETLFKNSGLFIEKYYPSSHHIEVQVFGNGQGKAIHFGERECSIQRRHQKVIEECPSPFVTKHPELREKLGAAAVRLAESIKYGSAGTIEYLVDDDSGDFFFLEMNTRLQVEHGITELCYGVDLVELMLLQADAELQGKGGLEADYLSKLQPSSPKGTAIEARVYAENPAKDYAPSPGTLQEVVWKEVKGSRIDTWVHRGTKVTSYYDPLLAKVMVHAETREKSIEGLEDLLTGSMILGPPTNMDFLATILNDDTFKSGNTMTKFLETFEYRPAAIDVLQGGAYTLVEDWPGRPTIGRGFSHSGPMDPLAFRIANMLVGNSQGTEGLEITLSGPDLRFLGSAIVALTGAPMEAELDGKSIPMWTRIRVQAGQRLTIGKTTGGGCRAYLAIHGGLPSIATWFGSKSTAPMTAVGGYQGRAIAAGDPLAITKNVPESTSEDGLKIPDKLIPQYPSEWTLMAIPGPYDQGFLTDDSIDDMYETTWTISHNASRVGIRLKGFQPKWARSDGGEGGSHPSNVIEYGYPVGTVNWTGDDPCLFPLDAPDFGGFVSALTVVKAEFWRMGQMKAGDQLRFRRVSYDDAIERRRRVERFLKQIDHACKDTSKFASVQKLNYDGDDDASLKSTSTSDSVSKAIIHQIQEDGNQPLVTYRQGGDDYLLIDYGHGSFNLNYRCRAVALFKKLQETKSHDNSDDTLFSSGAIHVGMPCGNSLMLYYDSLKLPQPQLLELLFKLESSLGDLSKAKFPFRKFKLPITFNSRRQTASVKRYMETQRPYASYLPDPASFVAENNGFTTQELRDIFTRSAGLMVVAVGFFVALPIALPIDPRQRIQCPKMNPSRVHTPEGQVGWGGSCMALYNVESPGGYMNVGLSIPSADVLGFKHAYSPDRPWLFDDFDQITFYEVSEDRYEELMAVFRSGRYVYEYEDTEFDMAEHNRMLDETRDEVASVRDRQRQAQAKMLERENELLEKWNREKEEGKISLDDVEDLLNDPKIHKISSPLNANVWKLPILDIAPPSSSESTTTTTTRSDHNVITEPEQTVAVLEAMKLEIPVKTEARMEGWKVEKVLVREGDVVEAGDGLVLLRMEK